MKAQLIILAVLAIVSLNSFKEEKPNQSSSENTTTTIRGTVVDECSGETLVGAEILLDETQQKAYTDFDGNFVFDHVPVGNHTISAKLISYKETIQKEIRIDANKNNNLKISMKNVN